MRTSLPLGSGVSVTTCCRGSPNLTIAYPSNFALLDFDQSDSRNHPATRTARVRRWQTLCARNRQSIACCAWTPRERETGSRCGSFPQADEVWLSHQRTSHCGLAEPRHRAAFRMHSQAAGAQEIHDVVPKAATREDWSSDP